MTRVAVFVDYQNVYVHARDAFCRDDDPPAAGQTRPLDTGLLLAERGRAVDPTRFLKSVHVFRGEPSPRRSPVGHAAALRQVTTWRAEPRVSVSTRPLQYVRVLDGSGMPTTVAREKGIDVLLAVAMVLGAERDEYDVAILFSSDTDLIPAIEAIRSIGRRCEVAAWRPPSGYVSRVRLPGLWCHWLDKADYDRLHDPVNYAVGGGR